MKTKKELNLNKKGFRTVLAIIFLPFILTFILEHFGDFDYQGYGGKISEVRITSATFTTPLGNKVITNGEGMGYERNSSGVYQINGSYGGKLPFYLKGMIKDSILPIVLMVISLAIYFFRRKYTVRIS